MKQRSIKQPTKINIRKTEDDTETLLLPLDPKTSLPPEVAASTWGVCPDSNME